MLWDYDAVLRIIHASRAVVAVICAHDHDGGYHRDAAGVHHLTLRSPLNRGAAGSAFGAVSERVCLGGASHGIQYVRRARRWLRNYLRCLPTVPTRTTLATLTATYPGMQIRVHADRLQIVTPAALTDLLPESLPAGPRVKCPRAHGDDVNVDAAADIDADVGAAGPVRHGGTHRQSSSLLCESVTLRFRTSVTARRGASSKP